MLAAVASFSWALHPWRGLSRMGCGLGKILGPQEKIHEERLWVVSARTGDGVCLGQGVGEWRKMRERVEGEGG